MITYDPKTAKEITIHLEGFASLEGARQFLEGVAKPELRSVFRNAKMTLEQGVVTVRQFICCGEGGKDFAVCDPGETECHLVGSGCPVVTKSG